MATTSDNSVLNILLQGEGLSPLAFEPELRRLGDMLLSEIAGQFSGERNPYGEPWASLQPLTIAIKRLKGSPNAEKILQDTGALRSSFKYEIGDDGLSLFTDRVFDDGVSAEIHQTGGVHPTTGRFIPSREMLPFRDSLPPVWMQWVEVFTEIGIDRIFK